MPRRTPRGFVGVRLADEERSAAQAIADTEHDGNLSGALRALLAEALAAREQGLRAPDSRRPQAQV